MNAEVKVKWLEALRSGEYKQGREVLRQDDTYCCLGVLCDLAASEGVGEWKGDFFLDRTGDRGAALPPSAVVEWAGLESWQPVVPSGDDLPCLNDTGSTFAEIADLIEAHL